MDNKDYNCPPRCGECHELHYTDQPCKKPGDRIIRMAEQRGEFITDVDGYVYYSPVSKYGHLAAHHLRMLADELDRRNAEWDKHVKDYFDNL